MRSFLVRLIATPVALIPPLLLLRELSGANNTRDGSGFTRTIVLTLLVGTLSIPCGYLAIVGAKSSPPPGLFWKCLKQIAISIGMFLSWVVLMALGNAVTSFLLDAVVLLYGSLGIAAVWLVLSVLSLVSNRDLLSEFAHITISGKKHDTGDKIIEDLLEVASPFGATDSAGAPFVAAEQAVSEPAGCALCGCDETDLVPFYIRTVSTRSFVGDTVIRWLHHPSNCCLKCFRKIEAVQRTTNIVNVLSAFLLISAFAFYFYANNFSEKSEAPQMTPSRPAMWERSATEQMRYLQQSHRPNAARPQGPSLIEQFSLHIAASLMAAGFVVLIAGTVATRSKSNALISGESANTTVARLKKVHFAETGNDKIRALLLTEIK